MDKLNQKNTLGASLRAYGFTRGIRCYVAMWRLGIAATWFSRRMVPKD